MVSGAAPECVTQCNNVLAPSPEPELKLLSSDQQHKADLVMRERRVLESEADLKASQDEFEKHRENENDKIARAYAAIRSQVQQLNEYKRKLDIDEKVRFGPEYNDTFAWELVRKEKVELSMLRQDLTLKEYQLDADQTEFGMQKDEWRSYAEEMDAQLTTRREDITAREDNVMLREVQLQSRENIVLLGEEKVAKKEKELVKEEERLNKFKQELIQEWQWLQDVKKRNGIEVSTPPRDKAHDASKPGPAKASGPRVADVKRLNRHSEEPEVAGGRPSQPLRSP